MSERIRVAFIRFAPKAKKAYMFEYPDERYLEEGDTVLVENSDGDEVEATVVDTQLFNLKYDGDRKDLERLLMVTSQELPLKRVLGTIERTYFKWNEEETEDEDE